MLTPSRGTRAKQADSLVKLHDRLVLHLHLAKEGAVVGLQRREAADRCREGAAGAIHVRPNRARDKVRSFLRGAKERDLLVKDLAGSASCHAPLDRKSTRLNSSH